MRVREIAHVLRISKQVLKSVMTTGDGWAIRVANNPNGELRGKVDNIRCNLKKRIDGKNGGKAATGGM